MNPTRPGGDYPPNETHRKDTMRIRIFPWRTPSNSATSLRDAFREMGHDALLIRRENSRYRPHETDVIINWGSGSSFPGSDGTQVDKVFNPPSAVAVAGNKRDTLVRLRDQGVSTVDFTTSKTVAQEWAQPGKRVFCRTRLRSSQGAGITIATGPGSVVDAPLYTFGETGKEYRVHVMIDRDGNPQTVKVQKRWKEVDDYPIRNHPNGYTFITGGFRRPHHIRDLAASAIQALDLDFGSVDIINAVQPDGTRVLKVLEVNTASGLEGSSPREMAEAFVTHMLPTLDSTPPTSEPNDWTFDPDTEVKVRRRAA